MLCKYHKFLIKGNTFKIQHLHGWWECFWNTASIVTSTVIAIKQKLGFVSDNFVQQYYLILMYSRDFSIVLSEKHTTLIYDRFEVVQCLAITILVRKRPVDIQRGHMSNPKRMRP